MESKVGMKVQLTTGCDGCRYCASRKHTHTDSGNRCVLCAVNSRTHVDAREALSLLEGIGVVESDCSGTVESCLRRRRGQCAGGGIAVEIPALRDLPAARRDEIPALRDAPAWDGFVSEHLLHHLRIVPDFTLDGMGEYLSKGGSDDETDQSSYTESSSDGGHLPAMTNYACHVSTRLSMPMTEDDYQVEVTRLYRRLMLDEEEYGLGEYPEEHYGMMRVMGYEWDGIYACDILGAGHPRLPELDDETDAARSECEHDVQYPHYAGAISTRTRCSKWGHPIHDRQQMWRKQHGGNKKRWRATQRHIVGETNENTKVQIP